MGHNTSLKVNLIFCCKYRKHLLRSLGEEVKILRYRNSQPSDFEILTMEVDSEHIHFLIEYDPKVCVTQIVKCLKRETTPQLREDHEGYLRKQFWAEKTFWSDGFFACSIGEASEETIRKYIDFQG